MCEQRIVQRNGWAARVISLPRQGKVTKQPKEIYPSPISASDIADVILDLCSRDVQGVYHVADRESTSPNEFAEEIARVFCLKEDLVLPGTRKDLRPSFGVDPRIASQLINKLPKNAR